MVEYSFHSLSWKNSKIVEIDKTKKKNQTFNYQIKLTFPKIKNYLELELHLQLFATVRPTNEQIGRTISGFVQLSSHSLAYGKTEEQMF